MAVLDPTTTRLSPHFLLSDMMGSSSIYNGGLVNVFDKMRGHDIRLDNGKALCEHALEPIIALVGHVSISYGFICNEVSRKTVSYQDPDKPSHHQWNLGAAVDIMPHKGLQLTSNDGAPIRFALDHLQGLPISRLITYSESPYICVAVRHDEVEANEPRMAWYENRYAGVKGGKPDYRKYSSEQSRSNALKRLQADGLDHPWRGGGFPSYHGGGRRQLQHVHASANTMVIDFLFDSLCLQEGYRNAPALSDPLVAQAFQMAGDAYEDLLRATGYPRMSVVSAYTSHLSPGWIEGRDWRGEEVTFELVPPEYATPQQVWIETSTQAELARYMSIYPDEDRLIVTVRRSDHETHRQGKPTVDATAAGRVRRTRRNPKA